MLKELPPRWLLGLIVLTILSGAYSVAVAETGQSTIKPSQIDPSELLEADPINEDPTNKLNSQPTLPQETMKEATADDAYPVSSWQPEAKTDTGSSIVTPQLAAESKQLYATLMMPYYFSAYNPKVDVTELDLGMVLTEYPGIDVAISWGALNELMAAARMNVQGASYTAGIRLQYLLRPENNGEVKPGIAASLGWRVQNYRTSDELRETIFRGNRVYAGMVISKDLGALARGLSAEKMLVDLLSYVRVHCEAMAEYQNGRINANEDSLNRMEFGVKAGLEMIINPDQLYLILAYQSLSDWINRQDQYVGLRYYPRDDFSLDVIWGWFGERGAINLGIAWIF